MNHTNAIYDSRGNDYVIDVQQKNECYQTPLTTTFNSLGSVEKPSSSKKAVVILGLIFATLVLVLGGVAAATAYALVEIYNIKSANLLNEAVSLQQNTDLSSKLEMLLTQELDSRIQQLQDSHNSTVQRVNILEDQQVTQEISSSISAVVNSILSQLSQSCDNLPTSSPAGYYYILSSNGSAVRQYCPSITTRCGHTGRWRSVANLDMTNSTHQCFNGWSQPSYSNARLCARSSDSRGCSSSGFLPTSTPYRSVCGFVTAYQFGTPDAFFPSSGSSNNIDSMYVDGASITHGSPRQHIWTFAAASSPNYYRDGCPCLGGNNNRPAFVGNDYFCDTGRTSTGNGREFYGSNPIWDGAGCGSENNCCSFNTPPWFYRELPQYSYNSLEIRLCRDDTRTDEDIALHAVTIYVK